MSTRTGPGRPVRAMWNASWIAARDVARVLDHDRVLDDRHRDAGDVGLLEAVGADQVGAHLAGDEDGRDRVHHRVGDRRDEVGRAGAAGGERHADAAGWPSRSPRRRGRRPARGGRGCGGCRRRRARRRSEGSRRPGMPNTVSTPSSLRHSMIASTARMVARAPSGEQERRPHLVASGRKGKFNRPGPAV